MNQALSCSTFAPYVEFEDGTKGCILIIYEKDGTPSVFLVNSPQRLSSQANANQKTLFPYEHDLLIRYINGIEKRGYPHNEVLRKIYAQYGIARLCSTFIGVNLSDMIHRSGNVRLHIIPNVPTARIDNVKECLARAKAQYTTYKLEDEVLYYLSDDAWWERSIIEQVMVRLSPPVYPKEWFDSMLKTIRTTYVGNIQKISSLHFLVDYGYRLASAYATDHNVKWWRVLERAVSMQYPDEGIKYSQVSFQEVVAFYGLAQYIATQQPFDQLTLDVEDVPLPMRIELFTLYKKFTEGECLEKLQNTDNPSLSQMPSKQDAQKAAKERMTENLGRVPDWLPEERKSDYAEYERVFCKDSIKEKQNAANRSGFEAYIIQDHKKVMDILLFVAHLGNGQMPLLIKVIRALQKLNYIKQDCFDDLPLFIQNATEQFDNINFDKANVRHNVEMGNNSLNKKYQDTVRNIATYLASLLKGLT